MSNTTTTRALAQQLSELSTLMHAPPETRSEQSYNAPGNFMWFHAADIAALLVQLSDELDAIHAVHINILRGMIQLSRMNALHIAGATDYDTIVARINDIRRGDQNVGDVFYALEAGEISIAKAMECVRAYLTTGETGEYAHAKQDNAAG